MKIKRLELKAFGPFTERTLDFSSDRPGLHVVYGPNEAGKSSSLRALLALFFGFETSGDNFVHPYPQFLVGGCLQGRDGRELTFFRRKKSKNSLFDQHDNPLDPSVLHPYLHGLEKNYFLTMYGLNHESLVRGGEGILAQHGEAGQALFAAGTGLASLKAIDDDLATEGDRLFRPRGSNQEISLALAQYKELQGQIRQATLASRDWQEAQRALDEAEKKLAAAHARRGRLEREKHQLERLKQALPYLGERRVLLAQLAALGRVEILPPDFGERRRQLENSAKDARRRLETSHARKQELTEKSRGISVHQGVLDYAESIEELQQGLGQYRSGKVDSARLEGQRIACRTEAGHLLRQIRPDLSLDLVEELRPSLAKRKTIQALAAGHEVVVQKARQADRLLQVAAKDLANANQELERLSPAAEVGKLAGAVGGARKAGDLDGVIAGRRQELIGARQECLASLQRLGLWSGTWEQFAQLAVPLGETVQRFEEEFRLLAEQRRQFQGERGQLSDELNQLGQQLREIEYGGDVPTEDELGRCRHRRDLGWQLLRRQWLLGEDVAAASRAFDPEKPLPEAYEETIALADRTADRLFREANRVQKHVALKARVEGINQLLAELSQKEARVEAEWAESNRRWRELWAPSAIEPLPPREMRAWLGNFAQLRFQVQEADKIAGELTAQEARRRALRDTLLVELAALEQPPDFAGDELVLPLEYAEVVVLRMQGEQARRQVLMDKIRDLQQLRESAQWELDAAVSERRLWQSRWEEALAPLGLTGKTIPAEALDFIESLQGCFDKLQEAEGFRKRREGIERNAGEFERKILAVVQEVAPDLLSLEPPQAVNQLKGRLSRAGQDQAMLGQYAEEIADLEKIVVTTGLELADFEEQVAGLRRLAGCECEEDLNEAERCSSESLKLKDKLAEVELALARIAEGIPLADLEEKALGQDPDDLPGRIEGYLAELEEIDPEIRGLSETIGREKNELDRMDGSDKAAELAEKAQQTLAKIRRLTERYIRLKLAGKFLREEIERYRAENQDPVLAIAGRYFRELTLGSLAGLRADSNEQGEPILVGVRPSGTWLPVAGMSSGTRDQLYLALRLASLEWRQQNGEPMPFIVDDILINFDDLRAQATLKALAELAEKTQVILFTHHRQVLSAAQAMGGDAGVFVHLL